MNPKIVRKPMARADLVEVIVYLEIHASLEVADRFENSASSSFEELAKMPLAGRPLDQTLVGFEDVRVWRVQGFESWLVFYRPLSDGIEIIRVLHGARDIFAALEIDAQ